MPIDDVSPPRSLFPSLSPGVLFTPTPDGGVAYDLVTENLTFVNPTGALVLDACSNAGNLPATLEQWATRWSVSTETVRSGVDGALNQFAAAGLVGGDALPPTIYSAETTIGVLDSDEAATTQAVGVHRLRIRSKNAGLVGMVADLVGLECGNDPTAEYRIIEEPDGSIRLVTDTEWHFADVNAMRSTMIAVVNDFVARTATDVVLHAAAGRSPQGATVVFPAEPGSGKSTLVGVLAQRGWDYLGDESATIRTGDLAVVPCAKPIGLNPSSCTALGLEAVAAGDVPLAIIAPKAQIVTEPTAPPAAIIAPRYVGPEGTADIETLGFTDALVLLVGNTLNLRYVGVDAMSTLVALAETVPVHRIAYCSSDEALCQISTVLASDSSA